MGADRPHRPPPRRARANGSGWTSWRAIARERRGRLWRYAIGGRLRGLDGIYVENSSTLPSETDLAFLALARALGIPVVTYVRDAQYLFEEYYAATSIRRRCRARHCSSPRCPAAARGLLPYRIPVPRAGDRGPRSTTGAAAPASGQPAGRRCPAAPDGAVTAVRRWHALRGARAGPAGGRGRAGALGRTRRRGRVRLEARGGAAAPTPRVDAGGAGGGRRDPSAAAGGDRHHPAARVHALQRPRRANQGDGVPQLRPAARRHRLRRAGAHRA